MPELNVHNLLPLQLAARFGDHDFVKFMLRKQCSVLWVWGPVTMHSISMAGIDSANDGSGDIMDLVARMDADAKCTMLLLDTFMQGLVNKLFLQKWDMYGRKLHYARRIIDLTIITLLCYLSMMLKLSIANQARLVSVAALMLGCRHHLPRPPPIKP